jgi:hypothetical protein
MNRREIFTSDSPSPSLDPYFHPQSFRPEFQPVMSKILINFDPKNLLANGSPPTEAGKHQVIESPH